MAKSAVSDGVTNVTATPCVPSERPATTCVHIVRPASVGPKDKKKKGGKEAERREGERERKEKKEGWGRGK